MVGVELDGGVQDEILDCYQKYRFLQNLKKIRFLEVAEKHITRFEYMHRSVHIT